MTAAAPRGVGARGWRGGLAGLAVAAGALAVLTSLWLFPLYSANRDDSVYVAMARLLEHGRVTLPADHDLFRPWASAVLGDRVVLKYTPPWPAVLAAGDLVTGTPRAALAVTAAATVVLLAVLAAEVLGDRTAGLVAGALLALSPLFVVQSATYLPYVFQLLLGLGFATLLLSGARRRSTARLVAAGAVFGVAAFARPFDAVLFAAPFVVLVLADGGGRPGWSRLGVLAWPAAGAAPLLAVSLIYDAVVLGHPLRLPYTVTGPQDGFGFGRRGVFPEYTIPFGRRDALAGLLANVRWLPSWTTGGVVVCTLAVVGLAVTRGRARWAVAALAVVVPLGYLPFWAPYAVAYGWRGLQTFGPFYYLPVLVPLTTFAAAALLAGYRRVAAGGRRRAVAGIAAGATAALLVGLTGPAVPDKVAENLATRDGYRSVQRFVAAAHLRDAVLLLPRRGDLGFAGDTPFLENDPALRQPVLYAEDRLPDALALAARFPDRALYRFSEDRPPGGTAVGRLRLERLRVRTGPGVLLPLRLTNPTGRPVVVAYLTDGHRMWTRTLDRASAHGRAYDLSWTITAPGAAATPEQPRLAAAPAAGVLAVGVELRHEGDGAARPGIRWERRVAYRLVDGGAAVQLLLPGQGWTCDDRPGAAWRPAATDNPVADLG